MVGKAHFGHGQKETLSVALSGGRSFPVDSPGQFAARLARRRIQLELDLLRTNFPKVPIVYQEERRRRAFLWPRLRRRA